MNDRSPGAVTKRNSSRSLISGILIGIGLAGFIDETVFHQILHWHHFYDKSTPAAGLVSDGLFHAVSWVCIVAGLFLFADLRRTDGYWPLRWFSGIFLGLGAFQLYDGTIQHKLLRLHQIRYHVSILPYDLTWNGIAVIALILGIVLLLRSQHEVSSMAPSTEQPAPRRR